MSPLNFNNDVRAACLPPSDDYLGLSSTHKQCFTSGWGRTEEGLFQTLKHNIQDNIMCNRNNTDCVQNV